MDCLVTKIDESWGTPKYLDEKMNDLKRKLEELNARKEDTKSSTSTELDPRKKLKKQVELWFRNVERINDEIQDLEQKIGERNVVSRGLLKGDVSNKIQEVEELLQRGTFHDSLVVDDPGWIGQVLSTTTVFGGAAKTCMEEIWAYLMDGDIQKIGVWGMGGVGKTTIMKLIQNQLLKENEKFNIVIWITVSKEMSIIKLQNRIARAMKETLDEDEDETVRAGMIYEMLSRKGKYVLILDDLWDRLSLEKVGIPEPSNGSKFLVTTRSLDVCRYLKCREVKMPTLSKQDAWGLFSEKVGPDVLSHSDILSIVKSVAEECAGLPLAIVTIASSMNGVRNIHEWRNALHELKRHVKSVNGILEEEVFQKLQFSYDRLRDEKVKHCFLCCALYPEDCEIDTDQLIKLWIAEGLVEEMDSVQMEIDKGHTILNKLKNSCLIENTTLFSGRDGVKLHDVVRDMALHITREKPRFLVRAGMREILDVRDWNEDLEKVSLMENWGLQIPWQMPPPKCPKLTTLLLSNCYIKSIPECFFEQMHGLKILDLSYNDIKRLPNSISNLENLKYLDLSETRITEIGDGILAKFTSLQHLNFEDILVRGEEIGWLRKLEFFKGGFYDLDEWKSFVQAFLHTSKRGFSHYNIFVGPENDNSFNELDKVIELNGCNIGTDDFKILSNVEELSFKECIVGLCEEGAFLSRCIPMPLNVFSSLSYIFIFKCKNIKKLLPSNWVLHNLPNLSRLCVEGCEEMEEIIASESELKEEGIRSPSFNFTLPNLCIVALFNLPELKSICGANGVMVCDSIEQIDIRYCPKLKRIPLNLSLQDDGQPSLPPPLKRIVASELEEEGISSASVKFTLPKLRNLILKNLPELKSICVANGVIVCDSIDSIQITNCPKLKRIPLNLPLQDDGQPSPPPSLRAIYIKPKEWEQLDEWDHPNAKSLLEPFVKYWENESNSIKSLTTMGIQPKNWSFESPNNSYCYYSNQQICNGRKENSKKG